MRLENIILLFYTRHFSDVQIENRCREYIATWHRMICADFFF